MDKQYALVPARIIMGWLFIWPFLDKLFGLGHSTCFDAITKTTTVMCPAAWLRGGSPVYGYLSHAHGPFAEIFHAMAGSSIVSWLFMIGLLGVGLSMLLGTMMKVSSFLGILMTLMMFAAAYDLSKNPLIDEHIVYVGTFIALMFSSAGRYCGLGKWWANTALVKKYPILE